MVDLDLSKFPSPDSEFCSERSSSGGQPMSSVAAAKELTRNLGTLLAPNGGWKGQVTAVHRALTAESFEWSLPDLTWNRVRSWFYGEARRVDYEEMVALQELQAHEEAVREHRQFMAATNELVAALAAEGASLNRRQLAVLDRIGRRSSHRRGNTAPKIGRGARRSNLSGDRA